MAIFSILEDFFTKSSPKQPKSNETLEDNSQTQLNASTMNVRYNNTNVVVNIPLNDVSSHIPAAYDISNSDNEDTENQQETSALLAPS